MTPLLLALCCLTAPADRATRIDGDVLRWADDGSEVALFGTNYYPPFSIDHHQLAALGVDHRAVIDQDLIHLQRLGLNCLRLHCFDREFSDRAGNLLDNEHLALLDHLVAAAKARGMYTVLTPIAWWGTPADSPGFSTFFTMPQMTGDPGEPRAAQRRFLAQFVQHRNPATGLTYAADPAVLAFELINEPIYPPGTTDEQVMAYVNALTSAVRETGCRKPLYFSYFHGRADAVAKSDCDGITYGWYPTGLVGGRMITDNRLSLVNDFPSMRAPTVAGKLKAVYEFDAADVAGSYLYPAMARAFRSGGAQFAAQFQYDAWPLAVTNVNWQTHFLSLPFAPGRALGFLIAGEAFRTLPRLRTYGSTPEADRFGDFRVSAADDLAELVTATSYLHSNTTITPAPAPASLTRVYGVGDCPVARYDGTGAVFLDRVAPGVWRLEVHPDAVWVNDPYGRTSYNREVSRVLWRARGLTLALPDLGPDYTVEPANPGNRHRPAVAAGRCEVRPGVYRLRRPGAGEVAVDPEYFAPPENPALPATVWHLPADALVAGADQTVEATVTSDAPATLWYREPAGWRQAPLARVAPYRVRGTLPASALQDSARYALVVGEGAAARTFPGARAVLPDVGDRAAPQRLWAATDLAAAPSASLGGAPGQSVTCEKVGDALRVAVTAFGEQGSAAGLRLTAQAASLPGPAAVRVRARSTQAATHRVELGLIQDDEQAYGYELGLNPEWSDQVVPLEAFRPLWETRGGQPDPARLKQLSLVFGTWLFKGAAAQPHGFEIASVELVPQEACWVVPVEPVGPPVPLLRPAVLARLRVTQQGGRVVLTSGPEGRAAIELAHSGFGPPPDSMGMAADLVRAPAARVAALGQCDTLRVTVRAATPAATGFELVLSEEDGSPWGTVVPCTPTWQTIDLPLTALRYFHHWQQVAGRGGEADRPRPGRLMRWKATIGSWLNPAAEGQPWAVQIAAIDLVKAQP